MVSGDLILRDRMERGKGNDSEGWGVRMARRRRQGVQVVAEDLDLVREERK